jgi:hypothetical protein
LIAQRTVRPGLIILVAPLFENDLDFGQIVKVFGIETFGQSRGQIIDGVSPYEGFEKTIRKFY